MFFAAFQCILYTFTLPDFNWLINGERNLANICGKTRVYFDGNDLILVGNFPLIVMNWRTAVPGLGTSGNPLWFMNVTEGNIIGVFWKNLSSYQITAAQLDTAF